MPKKPEKKTRTKAQQPHKLLDKVEVRVSLPELWRLEFVRRDARGSSTEANLPFSFELGLNRFSHEQLGVELTVSTDESQPIYLVITYRAVFSAIVRDENGLDMEKEWRHIAAQLAPVVLFPFIRETVATTTMKSGLPPLLPPIINFRNVFDPDEVVVPHEPEEEKEAAKDQNKPRAGKKASEPAAG